MRMRCRYAISCMPVVPRSPLGYKTLFFFFDVVKSILCDETTLSVH